MTHSNIYKRLYNKWDIKKNKTHSTFGMKDDIDVIIAFDA